MGIMLHRRWISTLRPPASGERTRNAPERVGHGNKVEGAVGVDTVRLPLWQDEGGGILEETVNILESKSLEALAGDLEERRAKVEDVDG